MTFWRCISSYFFQLAPKTLSTCFTSNAEIKPQPTLSVNANATSVPCSHLTIKLWLLRSICLTRSHSLFFRITWKVRWRKHIFDLKKSTNQIDHHCLFSSLLRKLTFSSFLWQQQQQQYCLCYYDWNTRAYSHVHVLFNYEAIAILASDYKHGLTTSPDRKLLLWDIFFLPFHFIVICILR